MKQYLFTIENATENTDVVTCAKDGNVHILFLNGKKDEEPIYESPPLDQSQARQLAIALIEMAADADKQITNEVMEEINDGNI